ncbi:hypothetical protein PGT21_037235 [Puccinia graminis f. sp. tritici]|uniref:Uncharacterized protein n=2 Tax=Puccinia graminis f. sp. tritici TaxID=56615 RepID=E3KIV5_PUCGT|nr:uncharacterized protein PGTG_10608 [Puccinia graminis f. sp. tritici CRL 75-36-700-3]KAA1073046.1 hypothetical protein PGTUg99_023189 [Puccinia graminis f. sp. tritici]EFP84230.2 hypothetical protein PGTG_10608 [Puccinia graminis f. sp. tritici CRL 75-36-700-3]KAA1084754.1 hypothetical protein PGT21_035088 [Puccinia graminis f. sp. tritici]KAA1114104.1 hypothetical protein PGTUg99_020336 [Puccinia graminis f. sp. tritici]KAA1120178.1 hypothetical protein PGT21_037235 [Puccinia graminis f. s
MRISTSLIHFGAIAWANAAPALWPIMIAATVRDAHPVLEGSPQGLIRMLKMLIEDKVAFKCAMAGEEAGMAFGKAFRRTKGAPEVIGEVGSITKTLNESNPPSSKIALNSIQSTRGAASHVTIAT